MRYSLSQVRLVCSDGKARLFYKVKYGPYYVGRARREEDVAAVIRRHMQFGLVTEART